MAKPIAYFGYSKLGLTVNFYNNSLNLPETYHWDFGDGNESELKNPSHTYSEMGFFTVKLVATNTDGESEPLVLNIGVGTTSSNINLPIVKVIDEYIPTILREDASIQNKTYLINKWQQYLQPLVEIPEVIPEEQTFNEFAWPGLVNNLIAQLVAYDIMTQSINQFITAVGPLSNDITLEDTTEVTNANKQIKSIETGPAKTEWHEYRNAVSGSEMFKNLGQAFRDIMKTGGAIDMLKENICQQASRLRIFLPLCGQLEHNTNAPCVIKKKTKGKHNANPFGITKRML